MTATTTSIDWTPWIERWERQQDDYLAFREQRFETMLHMLSATMSEEFTAIDLACGPGAITQRLLARFPKARVFAIDFDPVMLEMARARMAGCDRVTVVEADLKEPGWRAQLGIDHVDAALSTTAIHWLPTASVVALYRTLGELIRPGGVFMNGDFMQFVDAQGRLQEIAEQTRDEHFARAEENGVEPWDHWWDDLATQPDVEGILAERSRRFSGPRPEFTSFAVHRAVLLDAGFREVDTIWQYFADRVIAAIR